MSLVTLSKRKQLHKDTVTKLWQETNLVNALKSNPLPSIWQNRKWWSHFHLFGLCSISAQTILKFKGLWRFQSKYHWSKKCILNTIFIKSEQQFRWKFKIFTWVFGGFSSRSIYPSPFSNKPLNWKNLHI